VPWLTPETIPDDKVCRPVFIPGSSDWLAIVSGALTELTKRYNWEKQGAVTVDEAVAAMQEMIATYYAGCTQCELPGGQRVIRINPDTGKVEELGDDGTWQTPTGEYAIAPIPAREGGTPEDQNCLAAANATNVMKQLYENLTDSWNAHLSEVEALEALIEFLIVALGAEFAPIAFALAGIVFLLFHALFAAMAFVGADLWDSSFDSEFQCLLYECAVNDSGVVTFNWECFQQKLVDEPNDFGLTADQLRLYG